MCYSNSTLIRPPLLQWKSGLIIWEESLGGEGLVVTNQETINISFPVETAKIETRKTN
jgi:hypothetical protein